MSVLKRVRSGLGRWNAIGLLLAGVGIALLATGERGPNLVYAQIAPTSTPSPAVVIFQGEVWNGLVGNNTTPIPGVTVDLLGSNFCQSDAGATLIRSDVTDASGHYDLPLYQNETQWECYLIRENNLPGWISQGATSPPGGGSVLTPDLILYTSLTAVPLPNYFYDTPTATPTATATPTPTSPPPTATATATPTSPPPTATLPPPTATPTLALGIPAAAPPGLLALIAAIALLGLLVLWRSRL